MDAKESILDITHRLIKSFGSEQEQMRTSIKNVGTEIVEQLKSDPLRTLGVAFSVGFVLVKALRSPEQGLQKKLASAAGSALVYGLVNQIVKPMTSSREDLH